MKVRIVDLDSTISDDRWRQWLLPAHSSGPDASQRYHNYHALCDRDELINETIVRDSPVPVVIVTSRPECFRNKTEAWLAERNLRVEKLYMRPNTNDWPSAMLKMGLVWRALNDLCADIESVWDDRADVLEALRAVYPSPSYHQVVYDGE